MSDRTDSFPVDMSDSIRSSAHAPASSGNPIVARTSHTPEDPCRRFCRCVVAAEEEWKNDRHVFKWVDEGAYDEIEKLMKKLAKLRHRLDQDKEEIKEEVREIQDGLGDNFQRIAELSST